MKFQIKITLHSSLYLRDPEQTKLGQEIVSKSITLINKLGIDKFNFKKLAEEINSNEQSVYRYFENKHQLLRYLISWYWSWLEFRISFKTNDIRDPEQKLKQIIKILADSAKYDPNFAHIDESALAHIVAKTSQLSYLADDLEQEEKEVILLSFKSLCDRIVEIIKDVNPDYSTPKALATSMIRITSEQIFFSRYFQDLTELDSIVGDTNEISSFVEKSVFAILKN